jgi:FRG domain
MREEWIKHFNDLHATSRTALHAFNLAIPWYRGQARVSWKLVPSVFRNAKGFNYETNISIRFMSRARARMREHPPNNDFGAWLSVMRHHGLPTRLLDWSESLLLAAYFVIADTAAFSEDGCIWALAATRLNKQQLGDHAIFPIEHAKALSVVNAAFTGKNVDQYLAVIPAHVDLRMLLQQSHFTVHGGPTPLESLPHADDYLIRFVVPAADKPELALSLNNMGINESTVFPELDNLARYLSSLTFSNEDIPPPPPPPPVAPPAPTTADLIQGNSGQTTS